eukprot:11496349-Karenia_brevis.AAC.1
MVRSCAGFRSHSVTHCVSFAKGTVPRSRERSHDPRDSPVCRGTGRATRGTVQPCETNTVRDRLNPKSCTTSTRCSETVINRAKM